MELVVAWVLFPAVLVALTLGCGLLVDTLTGSRLPGALLLPLGFCVIVVVGQFATATGTTAELAVPAIVALAVAGFGLSIPWRRGSPDRLVVATAIAVFAVYALPVVLSGSATFAGYIKLDDTATWMALTDRVMEHGRSLAGLAPSSYEATLHFNLSAGYPVGVFVPLGVARTLSGQDIAWVIQPYLAFLAALLALSLSVVVRPLVKMPWLRALAVFLAAQAALLYGYSLWGGIKEIAAAALVALLAALVPITTGRGRGVGDLVSLSVATAALLGVLTFGGVVWLVPLLATGIWRAARDVDLRHALRLVAACVTLIAALTIPMFATGRLLPPTSSPLDSATAIGNLFEPLSWLQFFGIWPVGDFRLRPADMAPTDVMILVVVAGGLLGLVYAWRARATALLLYAGVGTFGALAIGAIGSPWVAGKALATASPSFLLVALCGAVALFGVGRRVEGGVLLAAMATGLVWSNVLAYSQVNLAPRGQLAELQKIGDRVAGQGPALMTEYLPYGVRHFLRNADPEGVSELRRRTIPLLNGHEVEKGNWADTDQLQLGGLLVYRTLVLRRSPVQSRPPSVYSRVYTGRYYEVWQRVPSPTILQHLPLGGPTDPSAVPNCAAVARLARLAGPGGHLVAVPRSANAVLPLSQTQHPLQWARPARGVDSLFPESAGTALGTIQVNGSGSYRLWLGGSVKAPMQLLVDGSLVGTVRDQLNNEGLYVAMGSANLKRGVHRVTLRYLGPDLRPGSAAAGPSVESIGAVIASAGDENPLLRYIKPAQSPSLCGRRWDWIEAVS